MVEEEGRGREREGRRDGLPGAMPEIERDEKKVNPCSDPIERGERPGEHERALSYSLP
jgi:hypothetical protein